MFDHRREIKEGLFLGFGFILLNLIFGISIGFPLLGFRDIIDKYGTVSILAPIGEELLWGSVLLTIFSFLPFSLNLSINIASFTIFHKLAYGASFTAANAAFIGAGIYRLLADLIITNQDKDISKLSLPVAGIVAHILINTYLIIKVTGLVIVGV